MKNRCVSFGAVIVCYTSLLGASSTASAVKELTSVAEYNEAKNSSKPTIIIFNSSSCGACITMEPFVKAAAENPEYKDKVAFYTITPQGDTQQLLKSEEVKAYPTALFFKGGKEVRRERGGLSEKEINDMTYRLVFDKERPQPLLKKAATALKTAGSTIKKAVAQVKPEGKSSYEKI